LFDLEMLLLQHSLMADIRKAIGLKASLSN